MLLEGQMKQINKNKNRKLMPGNSTVVTKL